MRFFPGTSVFQCRFMFEPSRQHFQEKSPDHPSPPATFFSSRGRTLRCSRGRWKLNPFPGVLGTVCRGVSCQLDNTQNTLPGDPLPPTNSGTVWCCKKLAKLFSRTAKSSKVKLWWSWSHLDATPPHPQVALHTSFLPMPAFAQEVQILFPSPRFHFCWWGGGENCERVGGVIWPAGVSPWAQRPLHRSIMHTLMAVKWLAGNEK